MRRPSLRLRWLWRSGAGPGGRKAWQKAAQRRECGRLVSDMSTNEVTVVVLAAGQGTRMKSRMAKVLHRAGGRALLEHAIVTALGVAPPERIFVVLGYQADAVREVAEAAGVRTIEQKEQLGTGHAVLCGEADLAGLGGRMVVTVGDCPLIRPETLLALA